MYGLAIRSPTVQCWPCRQSQCVTTSSPRWEFTVSGLPCRCRVLPDMWIYMTRKLILVSLTRLLMSVRVPCPCNHCNQMGQRHRFPYPQRKRTLFRSLQQRQDQQIWPVSTHLPGEIWPVCTRLPGGLNMRGSEVGHNTVCLWIWIWSPPNLNSKSSEFGCWEFW